ncbi:hypothetical protein SLEP1_g6517 [Rubroshorea leprosula]|uniref:Uncharacterized protein n=1 Tax=Rubroshorea leprosula TaxID=152421 RepID=A0AAV5I6D7_9ROSI|nr:hypothetical protein SLEP1_g6517 [Rubroshorea leprosula]
MEKYLSFLKEFYCVFGKLTSKESKSHTKENAIVLAKFEELNHIKASLGAANLSLALENDETRESEGDERLKLELIGEHNWKGVRTDAGGVGGDGDWRKQVDQRASVVEIWSRRYGGRREKWNLKKELIRMNEA